MTKCITALGNVPGNSILVYMRVPAAKSDLHISRVSSMLHFFLTAFIYRVGFGGVNYLIAICRVRWIAWYAQLAQTNCFLLVCVICPATGLLEWMYYAGALVYTVGRKATSCWCEVQAGSWVSGILSIDVLCDGEIWCNLRLQSMTCNTWLITLTQ